MTSQRDRQCDQGYCHAELRLSQSPQASLLPLPLLMRMRGQVPVSVPLAGNLVHIFRHKMLLSLSTTFLQQLLLWSHQRRSKTHECWYWLAAAGDGITCHSRHVASHLSYFTRQIRVYELLSAIFDSFSSLLSSSLEQIIAHLPPPSPSLCCPVPCPPTPEFFRFLRKRRIADVVSISDDGSGTGGLIVTWYVHQGKRASTLKASAGLIEASDDDSKTCASGQVLHSRAVEILSSHILNGTCC
jgi:hypothetical protein